jgi:glycosyltransferase involved in cell wall biosynthesis
VKEYKLSVVVLVYNTEEYLRDCLDSLVNQTLKDIEIIIVNDGSPDNSRLIIEEYQNRYDNIKVINQENSGGAIAGNNGLKVSTGEYVTIMDSDDIVPLDAYEKLYKKAKQTDADIVIGKANILIDGLQKEILYKKEREVWKQERVIESLYEFLDIFYDGFYWNKIFKRDLIFEHNCFMPPGMLYADRPMVHKAYLYAKRIAIIPDVVYFWRKRGSDSTQKSITQMISEMNNFLDRIKSCRYQIEYFEKYGDRVLTNEFLKRNIDRWLFPIKGIVKDRRFREVYLTEVKSLLSQIDDVYKNDLGIIKNLYIYMILNDLTKQLLEYLSETPTGKIIEENGKHYWALPYFRDPSLGIPDDLFEIKVLLASFIKIKDYQIDNSKVIFNEITLPDAFDITEAKMEFRPRYDIGHSCIYKLEKADKRNVFKLEINLDDFSWTGLYDLYLVFQYSGKEDKFRITNKMLDPSLLTPLKKTNFKFYFTDKGNFSFISSRIFISKIKCDEEKISIKIHNDEMLSEENLQIYFKDRSTKEKIFFNIIEDNLYGIEWRHFADKNSFYDLYFNILNQNIRVNINYLNSFHPETIKMKSMTIELYETKNGNVSIRTYSPFAKFINRIRGFIGI